MGRNINRAEVMNGLRICTEAKCRYCTYGDGNGCMKQLISDAYYLIYELLGIIEEYNKEEK